MLKEYYDTFLKRLGVTEAMRGHEKAFRLLNRSLAHCGSVPGRSAASETTPQAAASADAAAVAAGGGQPAFAGPVHVLLPQVLGAQGASLGSGQGRGDTVGQAKKR